MISRLASPLLPTPTAIRMPGLIRQTISGLLNSSCKAADTSVISLRSNSHLTLATLGNLICSSIFLIVAIFCHLNHHF